MAASLDVVHRWYEAFAGPMREQTGDGARRRAAELTMRSDVTTEIEDCGRVRRCLIQRFLINANSPCFVVFFGSEHVSEQ